ncbi:unnamed protein product [Rotaria sp. Silwood2]|nr:unnamed protein product [Rotaria sp. Silwood2]
MRCVSSKIASVNVVMINKILMIFAIGGGGGSGSGHHDDTYCGGQRQYNHAGNYCDGHRGGAAGYNGNERSK